PRTFRPWAPPALYTPSLHDALPIFEANVTDLRPLDLRTREETVQPEREHDPPRSPQRGQHQTLSEVRAGEPGSARAQRDPYGCLDRKSTRLNSSHVSISYAVSCLTK